MAESLPLLSRFALVCLRSKAWPRGRIAARVLVPNIGVPEDMELEFLQSEQEILGGSEIADLTTLKGFAEHAGIASTFRVHRGSAWDGPSALPWLDVERALVIGGGADYGHDAWLVLDYRSSASEPRVVLSVWQGDGDGRHIEWRQVAASFEEFWDRCTRACAVSNIRCSRPGGDASSED